MMNLLDNSFSLPNHIRGRNIYNNVIPTVCNLKNMLEKLDAANGDESTLKQWEKRSYTAYHIDKIEDRILFQTKEKKVAIIKEHILQHEPNEWGPSCMDIYLVAYVSQQSKPGKQAFIEYVLRYGITDKPHSAHAIWQVGKGDGVFLGILNEDGTVKDWNFFRQWVKGQTKPYITNKTCKVHNKLVRDHIPAMIEKDGKRYRSRILDHQQFIFELKRKVYEELDEYAQANREEEIIEELADLVEVIQTMAEYHGVTMQEVEKVRKQKAKWKGRFKDRVFLIEAED